MFTKFLSGGPFSKVIGKNEALSNSTFLDGILISSRILKVAIKVAM